MILLNSNKGIAFFEKVKDKLILVPRIYTNKPRTTGDGYMEHYTEVGKITGIDVAEDLIFAEVPNKKYQSHAIDAKGYNKCLFEVVKL